MKNKKLSKILSVFLAVVMVLCAAPLSGFTGMELPDLFSVKAEASEGNFYYDTSYYWDENDVRQYYAYVTGCVDPTGDIVIPETLGGYPVKSIGSSAFYGCTSLTSVTIGNSVTSIGNYAFRNCASLTSVTIPDSVTSIGYEAFENCTSLTSVTIGNSVTSIGSSAFYGCTSLTSVTIGNSVTSIGYYAFSNCTSLEEIVIPDSVTYISDGAFKFCENLKTVDLGNSKNLAMDYDIFNGCSSIESFTIGETNVNYCTDEYGVLYNKNKTGLIKYPPASSMTEYTVDENVAYINEFAFEDSIKLKKVNLPDELISIGSYAFDDCKSLKEIEIPGSLFEIKGNVFYNCTGLENVIIEEGLCYIDAYAFYNCTGLGRITIPGSVTSIGYEAFYGCTSLARVYYTGDIEDWCNILFSDRYGYEGYYSNPMYYAKNFYINNTLVKEIVIPDTVTKIKDYAFYSFEGITSVTIGNGVTSIGNYAFEDCTSLTSVTIGNSVTSIGNYAFRNCTNLTSVTIPDSVTSIGDGAFSDCTSLTSVTIPDSVTSIGGWAFYGCWDLTDVYYTGDIEGWYNISFGDRYANPMCYAENFYLNGELLENLVIPSNISSIKSNVFYGFDCVKTVTIPESVITIRENAFYDCDNIEKVYYSGTDEQWDEIAIYDGNDALKTANKTFLNGGHAHVYNSTIAVEPTCTETGLKALKCYCGHTYTEVIPATGHIWGKWVVTLEPTATKDGRKVRACTACVEAIQEQVIPKGTNPDIPDEPDDPETESAVKVSDFTLNYKGTGKINPEINVSGKYTVDYISSDEAVVTVDKDGNVTATGEGTAEITVIVTDTKGDLFADSCKVTVAKAWWQWIIVILLFGWIWY